MKEKLYRIIEPFGIYTKEQICVPAGNGFECWFMLEHNTEIHFKHRNLFNDFDIGDIVPFSQLEKWIKQGLHPIYFTEEVIKRGDKLYVDIEHMGKIADSYFEASNEFYKNNNKLKEIISYLTPVETYDHKGYLIYEDNLSEEEENLIKEVKNGNT